MFVCTEALVAFCRPAARKWTRRSSKERFSGHKRCVYLSYLSFRSLATYQRTHVFACTANRIAVGLDTNVRIRSSSRDCRKNNEDLKWIRGYCRSQMIKIALRFIETLRSTLWYSLWSGKSKRRGTKNCCSLFKQTLFSVPFEIRGWKFTIFTSFLNDRLSKLQACLTYLNFSD